MLSFDATPDCVAVDDCARPGPANELLAATAAAFVRRRAREHGGQRVAVVAQWEVAAALRTLLLRAEEAGGEHAHAQQQQHLLGEADRRAVGTPPGHVLTMEDVHAVGTPGVFENTAQIFEQMLRVCREVDPPPPLPLPPRDCDADADADGEGGASASAASPSGDGDDEDEDGEATSRLVLLAHPDHLRRAIRIGETTFAKAHKADAKAAAKAARGAPPCAAPPPPPRPPRLVPALQPYRLDWPSSEGATSTMWDKEEEADEAATGAHLDLYAGVSATVHTAGKVVHEATWRDAPNGFYPDGEPQRWAHRREVWAVYEVWARAKGVATGVIRRTP